MNCWQLNKELIYKIDTEINIMKNYIFITTEGTTCHPVSNFLELDIENCQVIGFGEGNNPKEAFNDLIKENDYLLETNFDEVICFELKHRDYYKHSRDFSLEDKRKENNYETISFK